MLPGIFTETKIPPDADADIVPPAAPAEGEAPVLADIVPSAAPAEGEAPVLEEGGAVGGALPIAEAVVSSPEANVELAEA